MNKLDLTHEKERQSIFLQALHEGTVEIMGTIKTSQIFSAISNGETKEVGFEGAGGFNILETLGNEFAIRYQRNTAKGLMIRIGEASFTYLNKEIPQLFELGVIENRLKPIGQRFDSSLTVLAELLSEIIGLDTRMFKKSDSEFYLEVLGSESGKVPTTDLLIYYIMGILRAFCLWLDSRKEYSFTVNESKKDDPGANHVCMKIQDME
jgi:hypothetical protein